MASGYCEENLYLSAVLLAGRDKFARIEQALCNAVVRITREVVGDMSRKCGMGEGQASQRLRGAEAECMVKEIGRQPAKQDAAVKIICARASVCSIVMPLSFKVCCDCGTSPRHRPRG